jgi:hypothetical protein
MRDQSVNSFSKGLAKDVSSTVPQEGLYTDAKNIRIVSDGDSGSSAIISSVDGNERKVQLLYSQMYATYSPDGQIYEELFNDEDLAKPVTVLGYTYFTKTKTTEISPKSQIAVIFGVSVKETVIGGEIQKYDTSVIYIVNLETFEVKLLVENEDFNFKRNRPIEAVCRYENINIQRVYWTDNLNPVRVINIAAEYFPEDVNFYSLTRDVTFTRLDITNVTNGGNLEAGVYQYCYRLKSLEGTVTRFSQPSNFVHVVDGNRYWAYEEDPENQIEYNGRNVGETTNKQVEITFNAVDSILLGDDGSEKYDLIELVAIYRTASTGYTSISIVDEKPIPASGIVNMLHATNENNIPISIEELTAFNQVFSTAKTLAEKDNRLFVGNVQADAVSLEFDARSYRYLRTDGVKYPYKPVMTVGGMGQGTLTYDSYNNPYNEPLNWFDDPMQMYKYQEDGITLGGTGQYIDFRFVKKRLSGNTASSQREEPPYVSGSLSNTMGDYKNPITAEKFKGYQRDETYRFGIILYDKAGNPGFVNWIADIRFPSYEDVDPVGGPIDYDDEGEFILGTYNYVLATTNLEETTQAQVDEFNTDPDNVAAYASSTGLGRGGAHYRQDYTDNSHVDMTEGIYAEDAGNPGMVSTVIGAEATQMAYDLGVPGIGQGYLYALGIEFRLKDLPEDIKDKVGGYSFVRMKRTKQDKSVLAVGALAGYFHYWDRSTAIDDGNATWFLSFIKNLSYTMYWHNDLWNEDLGIPQHNNISFNSPEFDFYENYLDVDELSVISQDPDGATYSTKVIGAMWCDWNNDVQGLSNKVYGYVYNTHILTPRFYEKHEGDQGVSPIGVAKPHYAGQSLMGPSIETVTLPTALAQQGNSYDTDVGSFLGIWNIVCGSDVSDASDLNVTREKVGVGETSQYFWLRNRINWNDFLDKAHEVYGDDKDYLGNEFDKLLLAVKKNNAYLTRYGGTDEAAVASSVYIGTGHIKALDDNFGTLEDQYVAYEQVWGGDTYVTMYDLTKTRMATTAQNDVAYPAEEIDDVGGVNMAFPVETTLNITLREGYHFANKEDHSGGTATPLNQYILNSVFNSENDLFTYTSKPIDYSTVNHLPNRIYFSDVKINNAAADAWRSYRTSNYADIDGNYGEINKLIVYNDVMYYLQDAAFGALNINPVSTVKDASGNNIVLGVGKKVIQDHKNISTYTGVSNNAHVISTQTGLYWFDVNTKKAFNFNPSPKQGLNPISDTKLMKSYFENRPSLNSDNPGVALAYDYVNNEVLYSFYSASIFESSDDAGEADETIVYNEMLKTFTSVYTFSSRIFMCLPDRLFSVNSFSSQEEMGSIYEHNVGNFCRWYGTTVNPEIEFIVNKHPLYTKVFDNLEWYVEGGVDTVVEMHVHTSNAENAVSLDPSLDENDLLLIPGVEYFPYKKVKENMTKVPVPRSQSGYRLRDTYMKVKLVANTVTKFTLHYVKTLFRISRR